MAAPSTSSDTAAALSSRTGNTSKLTCIGSGAGVVVVVVELVLDVDVVDVVDVVVVVVDTRSAAAWHTMARAWKQLALAYCGVKLCCVTTQKLLFTAGSPKAHGRADTSAGRPVRRVSGQ